MSRSESQNNRLKNIHVIGLGGTVAGAAEDPSEIAVYETGKVAAQSIISDIEGLDKRARITVQDFTRIGSPDLDSRLWIELAKLIVSKLKDKNVDGVVVLAGTDTLEELAFFLYNVIVSDKPVVITGAMRPATADSSDGPRNVTCSVLVAIHQWSVGRGVLVAMNDRVYSGYYVVKRDANTVDAFSGGDAGCLGRVDGDIVNFFHRPSLAMEEKVRINFEMVNVLPRVHIVMGHSGSTECLFFAAVEDGVSGIILVGMGAGSWPTKSGEKIQEFIREHSFPVVVSHGTGEGYVSGYGVYGLGNYCIGAGLLSPKKACIKLQLLLCDPDLRRPPPSLARHGPETRNRRRIRVASRLELARHGPETRSRRRIRVASRLELLRTRFMNVQSRGLSCGLLPAV